MVEVNQWLQDLDSKGFPLLEKELICLDYRSRSPLSTPSKIWKIIGEIERNQGFGGQQWRPISMIRTLENLWEETPFIREQNMTITGKNGVLPTFYQNRHQRQTRLCPEIWHMLGWPYFTPDENWAYEKCDTFCVRTSILADSSL
jgi:hypothetical protein